MSDLEWFRNQLDLVEEMADDPERAHMREDELLWAFVHGVADGVLDPQEAQDIAIVFREADLDFPHWTA